MSGHGFEEYPSCPLGCIALALAALAGALALLAGAFHLGAHGLPQRLPAPPPAKHGVAFRLHQHEDQL